MISTDWFEAIDQLTARQAPLVNELRAAVPVCPSHGLPTEEFSWWLNTYVCDPTNADFEPMEWLFMGLHGDEWMHCFAADARVYPSGAVLIARDSEGWR